MRLLYALCSVFIAGSRLPAQAVNAATLHESLASPSVPPGQVDRIAQMKASLRDLVIREEKHWANHGSYTTDMAALGLYPRGDTIKDAPWAQVIFAGSRGWTGMSTHPGASGKSCVVFVGQGVEIPKLPATMAGQLVAREQGVPVCDGE